MHCLNLMTSDVGHLAGPFEMLMWFWYFCIIEIPGMLKHTPPKHSCCFSYQAFRGLKFKISGTLPPSKPFLPGISVVMSEVFLINYFPISNWY